MDRQTDRQRGDHISLFIFLLKKGRWKWKLYETFLTPERYKTQQQRLRRSSGTWQ